MTKKIIKEEELTAEQLAILDQGYPVVEQNSRPSYPRMGILAEDITEETGSGKNKTIKVIQSAGTFFISKDSGETDENGKKIYTQDFLEENIDVIVAFHRYQLKVYDNSLQKYISSPIYDSADQVLPLYLDKQVIKRGTEKELQSLYPALTVKGKPTSALKKQMILYVVYNGEMYMLDTNQSSQFAFKDYLKTVQNASKVVTTLGSTPEQAGGTKYRKMTFKKVRNINLEELDIVRDSQTTLREQVESDARFLLNSATVALPAGDDGYEKELEAKSIAESNKDF